MIQFKTTYLTIVLVGQLQRKLAQFHQSLICFQKQKQSYFFDLNIRSQLINFQQMEKENKENFIELPLHAFKKKQYPIPSFLLESKLQRTAKNLQELRKIIESQQYICVSVISEERNIFCVKLQSNDKLGIIEVKEVSSKNRCIYVSLNLNSSLKKEIRQYFLMKNWKIENKIYIQDEKGSGIALLEYNFAEMDLRNFINKQQGLGNKLAEDAMRKMAKDLIQNLCYHHLEQITILDVRPQTILFQSGKWFILNGDYSSKTINQFGSTLSRPVASKFSDKRYLSPLILQNQAKSDANILHNPYKSDVYSLGLVLLELFTLGVIQKHVFKQMLQSRKGIKEVLQSFQFLFREKFLIVGDKLMKIPNLFRQMLAEKEESRSYIFQICLMMKFTTQLLSRILPPFEQFFKKQVIDQPNNRKRIIYSQGLIEYQGDINNQLLQQKDEYVRQGRGIAYYNGQRVFDGQWNNNLPSGKCLAHFSQLLSYEGHMQKGMLHGQGILSFNGSRIGQSRWYEGLSEQKAQGLFEQQQIQSGYYAFKEMKRKPIETKIYYHKIIDNHVKYIINLMDFNLNQTVLKILKRFFRNLEVKSVKIESKVRNKQYCSIEFELIRLNVVNSEGNSFLIDIMTGNNLSFSYLQKLYESTAIKSSSFELDCSQNTCFNEQSLKDLIEIGPPIKTLLLSGATQITDSFFKFLANQKNCSILSKLYLDGLQITDKSLTQLLFTSFMDHLDLIDLGGCLKITSQKLAQFLSHQKTFKLNSISISGILIDHHGLEKIIKNRNFRNISELNFGMCHKISDNMMFELIKLQNIDGLKSLSLFSTTFKDPVLQLLASNSTVLNAIQKIDLSGCINFTPLGFSKILLSQNVLQLEYLNLSGTQITDQLLSLLAKKSYISNKLKDLSLSCCYALTDKGIKQLLRPDKFIFLKKLNLSRNNFSNDTLFVLSEVTVRELHSLNLSKCSKVNDLGVQKFLNSQNARHLEQLDLSSTGIKQSIFSILTSSKYLKCLKNINLSECKYIDENSLLEFTGSERISNMVGVKLNNTFITEKTIDSIQNNPYLIHRYVKISVDGCKHLTEDHLNRLSLMRKISYEKDQSYEIIKNDPRELCQHHMLHRMTELEINKKQIPHLQKLFESEYLINLSKISLNWVDLDKCLDKMSRNYNLHNIKSLSLIGSTFSQEFLIKIVKTTIVKHLQYLDLSWTECSNSILFAMSQSSHLNMLRTLKLARCNRLNDKGFEKYFSSSKIATLTSIDLRSTLITNSTLQALFSSKYLKNLSTICVRSCPNIKDSGFKEYFKNAGCAILKQFDISWTKMSGQIFSYMSNSKKLNQLSILRISGLKGIEFELCKFIESSSASSLTSIEANYSEISSKIISAIASKEFEIKGLELNEVNLCSLIAMIRSSNTAKLKCLKITKGKQETIQKLLNSLKQYMGKIQQLCVMGLSDSEVQRWRKNLKNCAIEHSDKAMQVC